MHRKQHVFILLLLLLFLNLCRLIIMYESNLESYRSHHLFVPQSEKQWLYFEPNVKCKMLNHSNSYPSRAPISILIFYNSSYAYFLFFSLSNAVQWVRRSKPDVESPISVIEWVTVDCFDSYVDSTGTRQATELILRLKWCQPHWRFVSPHHSPSSPRSRPSALTANTAPTSLNNNRHVYWD